MEIPVVPFDPEQSFASPFRVLLGGGSWEIEAPTNVDVEGVKYRFLRWSDGITTPTRRLDGRKSNLIAVFVRRLPSG